MSSISLASCYSVAVIFQFCVLFSIPILFHVVNFSFYSIPVIFKWPIFSSSFSSSFLRCLNLSSTSSSSSSNNKIKECNLSMQYFASALLHTKLVNMHYTEKTVREIVTLCKIWNPHIMSTVLRNKNIENSENRLHCS